MSTRLLLEHLGMRLDTGFGWLYVKCDRCKAPVQRILSAPLADGTLKLTNEERLELVNHAARHRPAYKRQLERDGAA
jgi:hypothetical protein